MYRPVDGRRRFPDRHFNWLVCFLLWFATSLCFILKIQGNAHRRQGNVWTHLCFGGLMPISGWPTSHTHQRLRKMEVFIIDLIPATVAKIQLFIYHLVSDKCSRKSPQWIVMSMGIFGRRKYHYVIYGSTPCVAKHHKELWFADAA